MRRKIFGSLEEVTLPNVLSDLVQENIPSVCLEPFTTSGHSTTDSQFLSVDDCQNETPRYIIKRVRPAQDWSMQTTEDWHGRFVENWQHGLLDRLPEGIEHGVIACFKDEGGYGLLMHNFTHALVPDGEMALRDHETILGGMAALHAEFWQNPGLSDPRFEFCPPQLLWTFTSPQRITKAGPEVSSSILGMILEGRRLLPDFVERDLADQVDRLMRDPAPLCTALAKYPQTLVHGDFWWPNLGIAQGEDVELIVLDWSRPGATVPAFDLLYYLMLNPSSGFPISLEQSISLYKERLATRLGSRLDEAWWQPQLELSYLGTYALLACFKAFFATHAEEETRRKQDLAVLEWWSEKARGGMRWL